MEALHEADAIFFAAHSQGTIVSTHLIHRLILDGHLRLGNRSSNTTSNYLHRQRVCCLALCGIHLGPLAYLHKSSLVQPYIQVSRYELCQLIRSLRTVRFSTLSQRRRVSFLSFRSVSQSHSICSNLILDSGYRKSSIKGLRKRAKICAES